MATVHVVLAGASGRSSTGATQPALNSVESGAQTMTSSASSTQSTVVGPTDPSGMFWEVTVTGGNVFGKFGANPTAASGSGVLLLDGQTRNFAVSGPSEKFAIKDA